MRPSLFGIDARNAEKGHCIRVSVGEQRQKKRLATFGNYLINRYIPRVWGDFLDSLAVKREANQLRSAPSTPPFQKLKTAIEVTAAHADSITVVVEYDNRCDDEVTAVSRDDRSGNRLPEAEEIPGQHSVGSELSKNHFGAGIDYGRKNALFCAPCALDNGCRVDFVIARQVTGDGLARHEFVRVNDTFADS